MTDVAAPPGGWPKPPPPPRIGTSFPEMDAGVGLDVDTAREPAGGCSASSAWFLPVVLALLVLAARAAGRRPVPALRQAARVGPRA